MWLALPELWSSEIVSIEAEGRRGLDAPPTWDMTVQGAALWLALASAADRAPPQLNMQASSSAKADDPVREGGAIA